MDSIITVINQNPLYGVIGALLVLFCIASLLKKLVLVSLIAVGILAGFTFYLNTTGQEATKAQQITEKLIDSTRDVTKKIGTKVREKANNAKEKFKKKLRDSIGDSSSNITRTLTEKADETAAALSPTKIEAKEKQTKTKP